MNDSMVLIPISNMNISTISDDDLETAFLSVLAEHKDVVASIRQSMTDADSAYRKYLDEGYEPSEEIAKADRAALNKAEKNIAEKYASLKAAYEKPLESTEANIKAIRAEIKKASGVVDTAVKNYTDREKEKKRMEIRAYFNTKQFGLVPLERIFKDKWLNKTFRMPDVKKEIDDAISSIYNNIKILENIADHGMVVKAIYLKNLDMEAAMREAETLKANAEKLAREKVEREERERQALVARNAVEERREEKAAAKEERVKSIADAALDIEEPEIAMAPSPKIVEYTLRFKGTEQELLNLREYMTSQGIAYEKVVVFNTGDEAALYLRRTGIVGQIYSAVFIPVTRNSYKAAI